METPISLMGDFKYTRSGTSSFLVILYIPGLSLGLVYGTLVRNIDSIVNCARNPSVMKYLPSFSLFPPKF